MSAFELIGDPSAGACEGDLCAVPQVPREAEAPAPAGAAGETSAAAAREPQSQPQRDA